MRSQHHHALLRWILLLHLLLIDDTVFSSSSCRVEAKGGNNNHHRSSLLKSKISSFRQLRFPNEINNNNNNNNNNSNELAKKFLSLTEPKPPFREEDFDTKTSIKKAAQRWTSTVIHTSPSLLHQDGKQQQEQHSSTISEDGDNEPYPRRRLTMVSSFMVASSPSKIAQQGLMISSSMKHLQVAYKTMGDVMLEIGQKIKHSSLVAIRKVRQFLIHTFKVTTKQCRVVSSWMIQSSRGTFHNVRSKLNGLMMKRHQDTVSQCPTSSPIVSWLTSSEPSAAATCSASSQPTMSSSISTWLSPSPSTSSSSPIVVSQSKVPPSSNMGSTNMKKAASASTAAPAATKASVPVNKKMTTPTTKKSKTKSDNDGSSTVSSLFSSWTSSSLSTSSYVPQPSLLGGLYDKLLGGLLVVGVGSIVGYFWSSDWRSTRLAATSQDFIDADSIGLDMNGGGVGGAGAIPVTPEPERY